MYTFIPGQEAFFDSASPAGRWAAVFEDDGTTGYLYAYDLEEAATERNPIQEALHIYNVENIVDRDQGIESVAVIGWSTDGQKVCLLINDFPHAVIDFEAQRCYCRTGFPGPGKWTDHDFAWDDDAMRHFEDPESASASLPGNLPLSTAQLAVLRPDLFGLFSGVRERWGAVRGQSNEIAEIEAQLLHGDSQPAIVMRVAPLLVAAYSDELDAIAMLQFPQKIGIDHQLRPGTRLLTVNSYSDDVSLAGDLEPGPHASGRWASFYPIIADFLAEDQMAVEMRKTQIPNASWQRTLELGQAYMARRPECFRDGRPGYSRYPAQPPTG